MLQEIYPRDHARFSSLPVLGPHAEQFVVWLHAQGYPRLPIRLRIRELPRVDELLRQRLDTLAVQFKEAQPSFYNAYRTARRIVDNPAGHTSKTPQASAATETATVSPPTIALKKAA